MYSVDLINLTKKWGSVTAVNNVNLHIQEGEFVVLLGPSGCGKTTTMRLVAGLEEITTGEIKIGDQVVNEVDPRKRDVSMVFQNYSLFPHMSVRNNIAYPLKMKKIPSAEQEKKINYVSKLVELQDLLDRKPAELSGGQRQRVALARAIVRQPRVFLMDEPLSNLDAILRVTMRSELKNLHHRLGVTTIYVTHDQVEAMTLASRIAVMSDGKLLQYDTPQIIFDEPSTKFVAGFIGSPAMNLINGKVVNGKFIFDTINTDFNINYEGNITLGIRPDKIDIVDQNSPNNGSVKVFSNESTGETNLITCKMEDQSLIIKADKNTNYEIDNEIFLNFKKEDCYFFDSKSEDRLKL